MIATARFAESDDDLFTDEAHRFCRRNGSEITRHHVAIELR